MGRSNWEKQAGPVWSHNRVSQQHGSGLVIEEVGSDDEGSSVADEPGIQLSDVPAVKDLSEVRRTESALESKPESQLTAEDKIWQLHVAAKGPWKWSCWTWPPDEGKTSWEITCRQLMLACWTKCLFPFSIHVTSYCYVMSVVLSAHNIAWLV